MITLEQLINFNRHDPLLVVIDKMVFAGLYLPASVNGTFGILTPAASRFSTYTSIWFYRDARPINNTWPPIEIKLPSTDEERYACERLKERWKELCKSANPKFEPHDLEPILLI